MDISNDLAAVHYAATLRPDPTLDADSDAEALAEYHNIGTELATSLLNPEHRAVIRCDIPPKRGQLPKAIATVHDGYLLLARGHRGPNAVGLQLVRHYLVDLRMAEREEYTSVTEFCEYGDRHELPFQWLRRARGLVVSDRKEMFARNPVGEYIRPDGTEVSNDGRSIYDQAFAITTGPLDGDTILTTLSWMRAAYYWNRFGPNEPFNGHFDRMIGRRDSRGALYQGPLIRMLRWSGSDDLTEPIRRVEQAHQ